jgi:hypothetical protein
VLGHESYDKDKQPVKVPAPAESEYHHNWQQAIELQRTTTATPRRAITPLKKTVPSRSPTATPPAQQVTTDTLQPNLANMTKEEKAAEMNRRKEERKQVSRGDLTLSRLYDR